MTPVVGYTYERENERRKVIQVTKAGTVTFWTWWLYHDNEGKLGWTPAPRDVPPHTAKKLEWGEWAAWASEIPREKTGA